MFWKYSIDSIIIFYFLFFLHNTLHSLAFDKSHHGLCWSKPNKIRGIGTFNSSIKFNHHVNVETMLYGEEITIQSRMADVKKEKTYLISILAPNWLKWKISLAWPSVCLVFAFPTFKEGTLDPKLDCLAPTCHGNAPFRPRCLQGSLKNIIE